MDPRHFPGIKGLAKTVEELGGKWAPNPDYGKSIVTNYLASLLAVMPPAKFSDIEGHWAQKLIESTEWVTGYPDGTFKPDQPATRAETVAMIIAALSKTK